MQLYDDNPDFLRPKRAYNEMYSLLKQGLQDQPITRTIVKWGIPSPWDAEHVIYVWVEALQNYITAIGYPDDAELFERMWPADVHLIGKEIVRHHAVVWPAMLMSVGLPLPKRVFAHGWLLVGGEKISKSGRGITDISPYELDRRSIGLDAYRFHFVRAVSFGDDGNFSLEDMHARYNAELANDLGNLASRTLNMIERYFDGVVPDAGGGRGRRRSAPRDRRPRPPPRRTRSSRDLKVTEALARVWEIVRHANRYLVEREPWKLAKDEANTPLGRRRPERDRSRARRPRRAARAGDAGRRCGTCGRASATRVSQALDAPDPVGQPRPGGGGAVPPARGLSAPGLTDSHCHLGHIERPVEEVLAEAAAAGVGTVIDVGMGTRGVRARRPPGPRPTDGVCAAVGIHPNDLAEFEADPRRRRSPRSRELAALPDVVAIGETGLDLYRDRSITRATGAMRSARTSHSRSRSTARS